MPKSRLLFMGTPEFAVPSLKMLIHAGYPVVGVTTQPDKPKGRGQRLQPSPVKELAEEYGLLVLQPERVRDDTFLQLFRGLNPDLVVVAAFGQILPGEILERPKLGCLNVHPSLLPKYRGAAPLNWALIRGEKTTGVTIMMMDAGVDTGDIILQEETPVREGETCDGLHDRLAMMGADLLLKAVGQIEGGTAVRTPQDHQQATHAPRLKKEDGRIDWGRDAAAIVNFIRGLAATPGAYTSLGGKVLKIFRAEAEAGPAGEATGEIGPATKKGLPVTTGNGCVYLQEVQLEGKNRMTIQDFLRGYRLPPHTRLG
ncbi:MAG: methionyl-tRNA formyltransferase [Deltaproteobacteria bacterium]|nr:methionyl-tRNA formyltransferase [Deltaproteobacteria bacterium]